MQLNASHIEVLQAQDDVMNSIKEVVGKEFVRVFEDKKAYKKLLKDLIVQGLIRLKEPTVLLRCREIDKKVVDFVLEESKKIYANKGFSTPKVIVDDRLYLPPPSKDVATHEAFCSGGVLLASQDGNIVCENTLDARLDVIFRKKLPEIRKSLLG